MKISEQAIPEFSIVSRSNPKFGINYTGAGGSMPHSRTLNGPARAAAVSHTKYWLPACGVGCSGANPFMPNFGFDLLTMPIAGIVYSEIFMWVGLFRNYSHKSFSFLLSTWSYTSYMIQSQQVENIISKFHFRNPTYILWISEAAAQSMQFSSTYIEHKIHSWKRTQLAIRPEKKHPKSWASYLH